MSQDIVNALEDPNGTEVLVALLESGANVALPTKVSSQRMIFHKAMTPSYPAIPFCFVWWGKVYMRDYKAKNRDVLYRMSKLWVCTRTCTLCLCTKDSHRYDISYFPI